MFKKALGVTCVLLSCTLAVTSGLLTTYERYKDSRYQQTTSSTSARSAVECCLLCRNSENCGVANFHVDDKICEIRNTLMFDNAHISDAPGWNMFIIASCAPGWTKHQRSCYMMFTQRQTWPQATGYCESVRSGGHLANIHSQETNDFMASLYSLSGVTYSYVWIGGYRVSAQDFMWTDGSIFSDGFQNWNNAQPDFSNGQEYCVHFNTNIFWNDNGCDNLFPGVCEYELN